MSVMRKGNSWTVGVFGALLLGTVTPNHPVRADEVSDSFDDPRKLAAWTLLTPNPRDELHQTLDVGKSREGWLTLRPRVGRAWYNEGMGPMVFKEVEGDFLLETRVATHSSRSATVPPAAAYNSAGLIVRDPASGPGKQNWVVVNVGRQDPHTGTEVKSTVNSVSRLELQPGEHHGRLRLARIGTALFALRMLDGEARWTLLRSHDRPDLPKRVQVGLMCNGWTDRADLVAQFDYVQFRVPTGRADLSAVAAK